MSYCRWSSDDGQCDVYVYEDVYGGWTCHVAGRRVPLPPNYPPSIPMYDEDATQEEKDKWWKRHWKRTDEQRKIMAPLRDDDSNYIQLDSIAPEFAGETFNEPTPGDMADLLCKIRAAGLNVPQYAIDALREEEGGA